MATYLELLQASANDTLNQKVRVAVVIAAEVVRTEGAGVANHTARTAWAKSVYADPDGAGKKMIWAVLAQNATTPLANILAAPDATIQTAVNAAIDALT